MRRLLVVPLLLFMFSVVGCGSRHRTLPETANTAANIFHGCPAEGDATVTSRADPALNRLKNRVAMPMRFEPMNLQELLSLGLPPGESQHHRDTWPQRALQLAEMEEQRAVTVQGYLLAIKHEGPESCNCHSEADRDFHLWLAASPEMDRAQSAVIEISPRVRAQHPTWQLDRFEQLIHQRSSVRISGWLMFDPEHPDQIVKTRATLWEIHPILKIEVRGADGWREL